MTEAEWHSSDDPAAMLALLVGTHTSSGCRAAMHPGNRKLRLFSAACYRLSSHDYQEGELVKAWEHGKPFPGESEEASTIACQWCDPQYDRQGDPPLALRSALLRDVMGNPLRPVEWSLSLSPPLALDVLALARAAYEERLGHGTLDPVRLAILADALEEAGCDSEALLRHLRGCQTCPLCAGQPRRPLVGRDLLRGRWQYVALDTPGILGLREQGVECLECTGTGWIPLRGPHVRGCWAVDCILGKE